MNSDRYNPQAIETECYQSWMAQNRFAPSMDKDAEPFCIVIPPPNVTGSLHMGHAWDCTLQDILIRWKRMQGKNTLWIPGMDHAGIAMQWMVEKNLRERGLTKEVLGREKFLKEAWAFKEASKDTIVNQLKAVGISCDWSRERFTLDATLSQAVRRVFVQLYREGLIYKDHRMVNWCTRCLTALSDLEVNYKEHDSFLYHLRYPLRDEAGYLTIATTRPETMLGDGAVAVHPSDARYTDKVGKVVILPLIKRELPIIADSHPDPAFGSGAVKITAAHDVDDFEVARRHNLPLIFVMEEDGRMSPDLPERYRQLDRFEARKRIVEDLKAEGLVEAIKPHRHAVGHCSRCDTVAESRVSLQWFVKMEAMAQSAVKAVKTGQIKLLPNYQEKIFDEWMHNIRDWCVSRQLWWGHQIPAWYCSACDQLLVAEETPAACTSCGEKNLRAETDVLDTWFSSALWPFSTMGWPEQSEDLDTFYPTSVLITGYDILFFWVARMAMLGIKMTGQQPFAQVLLHGLLRDAQGEKMSKTKGNGLDPVKMIDGYGADALRFTLATGTVLGRDMVLQESSIASNRNFVNKIWNATRFALTHQEALGLPEPQAPLGTFDKWLSDRLQLAAETAGEMLEQRRFNEATSVLYHFVWHELCDWYIEITKPLLYDNNGGAARQAAWATLHGALCSALELLHPFMPFVTEVLWQRLRPGEDSIMVQSYPAADSARRFPTEAARANQVLRFVQVLRTLRGENGVKPQQRVAAVAVCDSEMLAAQLAAEQEMVCTLVALEHLSFATASEAKDAAVMQADHAHGVGEGFEVFISLVGAIDISQERNRMSRERERTQDKISKLSAKLDNTAFLSKAPAHVVEKNRHELFALQSQLSKIDEGLSRLSSD